MMTRRIASALLAELEADGLNTLRDLATWYDFDSLPFDNAHPDVTLRQDDTVSPRYWVHVRGRKIGWVYRNTRRGEWSAYVVNPGKVEGIWADSHKRRKDAVCGLLVTAFRMGEHLLAGRSLAGRYT